MRVFPLWLGQRPCESRARGLLLGTLALATLGCIPSHRLVHEGDRYFERCYGADFEARLAETRKEACWQAWLTYYTKHQPAHRVDYALARIESLQAGEPSPQLPDDSQRVPNLDLATSSAAKLMEDAGPTPNGCLHFCNEFESTCNVRCQRGSIACSSNCERERSFCLNGCY